MICESCGQPVVDPRDYDPTRDRYADTPGGHADRHTLVIDAAARAIAGHGR